LSLAATRWRAAAIARDFGDFICAHIRKVCMPLAAFPLSHQPPRAQQGKFAPQVARKTTNSRKPRVRQGQLDRQALRRQDEIGAAFDVLVPGIMLFI
jgi:hypothetical protein